MAGEMTILGSSVLALLLAGYLAQQYLPPPKPKVIGVDLGTTYCSVGVFLPGSGRVLVIADKAGRKSLPSVVSFTGREVLAGYAAQELADVNPLNTIYDAKRFIGKLYTPEELRNESNRYQFKVLYNEGRAEFSVPANETWRITPEFVGSRLLLELKRMAEEQLGIPVSKAVISVPADFDERQRNYTVRAAKMAGNNQLGGQDFNQRLLQFLFERVHERHGVLPSHQQDIHRLRQAVEEAKLNLTMASSVSLRVPLSLSRPGGDRVGEEEEGGRADEGEEKEEGTRVWFRETVTRERFEELNQDLFQKILLPIEEVLRAGRLDRHRVDEIVLVGGSTRIPRIRQVIREFFGKEPNTAVDPDLAVVIGTAIQAGIMGGSWPLQVSALEIPNRHLRKTNFS
eukprot:gi/632975268/ref/XP_007904137.1/ PREDICTED: heat shock 70 kDa protein 13 isoform X2 [Callorhinchus milii]